MPDDMVEAHLRGVRNALAVGWHVLEGGGSALDAIEEAVVVMEDDETFDAGRGSFLNRDGKGQVDALIMDGATPRPGGGGGVGGGAAEHGIALCRNEELIIPREVERLREYQAKIPPLRQAQGELSGAK